jgi:predicted RNA-binding Zn-ribbon protein involved in translation (DUF1610 family)
MPEKKESQKVPSEDAREGGSREVAVRFTETGDKVPCPTCGLKLTRREGYGKLFMTGENAGRKKIRWQCRNPECDRFGKNFLCGWAN